jgi:hypothetical protein
LFLQSEHDVFISHKAEKPWVWIAAEHPNVHVIRIPDAGHLPGLDDLERVVAAIERFPATEPPSRFERTRRSLGSERRTAVRRGDPARVTRAAGEAPVHATSSKDAKTKRERTTPPATDCRAVRPGWSAAFEQLGLLV